MFASRLFKAAIQERGTDIIRPSEILFSLWKRRNNERPDAQSPITSEIVPSIGQTLPAPCSITITFQPGSSQVTL